jgi:hypothetical protein
MTLRGRWLAVGVLAVIASTTLGCGSDSIPQAPQTLNIHTSGDSIAMLGGFLTILVPPGAVSEDGNVTVTILAAGAVPANPLLVRNSAVEITVSPATLQVLQPITVRLNYAALSLPTGVRGAELRLHKVVGGAWQPVAGGSNESAAGTVSADVSSFGDFGALALPVASVDVNPATISLAPGATQSITATPTDSLGNALPDRAVTFSSSDTAKARVAASGLVTGVAAGSATITVTSEGRSAQVSVTVAQGQGGVSTSRSTVSVSAATVASGGTVTLTLQAKDASGNNLTSGGLTVGFTASGGTSTGAIGPTSDHGDGTYTAVFTGGTAGTATTIHATIGGAAVTSTPPTVTVTPGSVSTSRSTVTVSAGTVAPGGTVTLTLQARDAAGNNLTGGGLAVAFSVSGGTSTGTIGATTDHANGTYTAVFTAGAAGTATTVHATIGGVAVSSTLPTITVATVVAGECATPQTGWIWCDDFEQNRLSSYFEYDNSGGGFVRAASVGLNGSYGMRARWSTTGQVSAGALHLAFGKTPSGFTPVDAGTQVYRDVYWRMYVRTQPGWTGGSAVKLSRAIVFASSNWAEAAIAHVWGDADNPSPYVDLDPVRGTDASGTLLTTTYNDFAHFTWLGLVHGSKPLFADNQAGNWFCVEAHMRLNDAGQSNGVFETWINDTLDARASNLNFLGSYSTYGINAVFFENYWNAGAVQPEERYFDNLVVSTQRIGC